MTPVIFSYLARILKNDGFRLHRALKPLATGIYPGQITENVGNLYILNAVRTPYHGHRYVRTYVRNGGRGHLGSE